MKKAINIIILGICFLMIQSKAVNNLKAIPDTFVLEIEGKIVNAGLGNGCSKIELLCDNRVIDSFILKDNNKKFVFNLRKNMNYTIRISKNGFVTRLVCVDTKLAWFNENVYRFAFETKLIDKHASVNLNKDILDLPIAIIYFDEKKNCFYYNKSYTSSIKKELAMK